MDTSFNNKTIFDYQNIHLLYGSNLKKSRLKKAIAMDIKKIIGRPDPLIPPPELNKWPQGKVQNIFIMLAQSLDQRKTVRNRVKCWASFLARLRYSSILENLHITQPYVINWYK